MTRYEQLKQAKLRNPEGLPAWRIKAHYSSLASFVCRRPDPNRLSQRVRRAVLGCAAGAGFEGSFQAIVARLAQGAKGGPVVIALVSVRGCLAGVGIVEWISSR